MKRRIPTPSEKKAILAKQNGRCTMCRASLEGQRVDFDHIHALCHGGDNDRSNLRAICRPCHLLKTAADLRALAKIRRLRGETGVRKKLIASRGFDKRLTKRFDGSVVPRKKARTGAGSAASHQTQQSRSGPWHETHGT